MTQNDGEDDSDAESEFDEAIVVTRQEEAINPEDEADFEREYAKMMAESLESRKFERKQQFDVPLPVRPKTREPSSGEPAGETAPATGNKMAFSLLTKKGNRQQVGLDALEKIGTCRLMGRPDANCGAAIGLCICSCHEVAAAS